MDGFIVAGKAFAIFEDLKRFAEKNKGKPVADYLKDKRKDQLERAEAEQFGVTVEEFRGWLK